MPFNKTYLKISKSFPLVGGVLLLIDRFITDYPDPCIKAVDTEQRPAGRSITQVEQHWTQAAFTQKFTMLDSILMQQEYHVVLFCSVQFSSFGFHNPGSATSPIQRRFSCRSWAPLVDDIITELT